MTVVTTRRVLVVAETYLPEINGAAIATARLAHGLWARGMDVRVVAPRPTAGPAEQLVDEAGVLVHRLRTHPVPTHDSIRLGLAWEVRPAMARVFDEFEPDVVHVQCHYTISNAAIREANRRGIPVVATNHFMPENLFPFLPFPPSLKRVSARILWWDMDRKFRRVNVLTTPTQLSADAMAQHGISSPVRVVSNGIDTSKFPPIRSAGTYRRDGEFTLLFVGRLAREKHVDQIIRALALLPTSLRVRLEVVGGGEQLQSLEALARSLNVSERVHFHGRVSDEALHEAYGRASAFCMPGTADLQSLASLEALSASLPVLLANALALPHLVRDGENGYLFEPGGAEDLADKIGRLAASSTDEIARMGAVSRTIAEGHSIERSLNIWDDLYDGLVPGLNDDLRSFAVAASDD